MEFISFGNEQNRKDGVRKEPKRLVFCGVWIGFAGDNAVKTNQGLHLVYMHAGTNPFEVINQAVKWVLHLPWMIFFSFSEFDIIRRILAFAFYFLENE